MKKCLIFLILVLFLTLPVFAGEGSFSVIYLPADDRPLHDEQMGLFADSLGVELIMPERSLYGRDPSDHREVLLSWLLAQKGDYYIVSLDSLLSGGLLESREMTGDTVWEEQVILRLKGFSEGKEGYFLDSLLRLASNVESEQELKTYNATLDFARGLRREAPEDYLEIRQRKLRLNLLAGKNLPGYLLGVDDSWEGETVQRGELAQLGKYVPPENIFSTFDALPRLALAKLFLEETGQVPGVRVRYFGDETIIPTHNFESAEEMTNKALRFFGIEEGDDLDILILTEIALGNAVIKAARENQKRQIPTILINLCPRQENFEQAFLTLAPGQLLAYSGYGSSVNATHLGLSMGLARYAALGRGMENIPQQTRLLATLLADEFGYAAILEEVEAKARELGLDIYDFRRPFSELEAFTLNKMRAKTRPVLCALNKGSILTGVSPYRVTSVERVTLTGGYFPWHRCFEYHGVIE